jgi:hypothetical protein
MSQSTKIANLALSHLGVGKEIGNLTTERSEEALACRMFYDQVGDIVLRDFAWPFATRIEKLALITEKPNLEWSYSYQYPSDCVMLRRILSGQRLDTPDSRVPFRLALGTGGQVILTDSNQAQAEYTARVSQVSVFPQDFVMAYSLRLAAYIAPRVTGGDPFKMGDRALQLYGLEISKAMAMAASESQPDFTPDSEFIRARD